MLRILYADGGKACPVFDCDVCDGMISVPHEGVALWFAHQRDNLTKTRVFHAHASGPCEKQMREHMGGSAVIDSQPLAAHLYYLCANLDVGPDELKTFKARYSRAR